MIDLGLKRIARLLSLLDNPQNTWKAVHVAGTNGKGSVCAYLSNIATASNIPNGRFTSPHLIKRWDCICINGKIIQEQDFISAENYISKLNSQHNIGASEFELLTATAFELFKRANIQLAIIEVGLGGRLDATNILSKNEVLCSVITNIGMDHQNFLGDTLSQIAREKAGIIKPGVPCVVDGTNKIETLEAVKAKAEEAGSKLIVAGPVEAPSASSSSPASPVSSSSALSRPRLNIVPPLVGAFQLVNVSCALHAIDIVQQIFPQITDDRIREGIAKTTWPGRLQWTNTKNGTRVLIDGAHNNEAADQLAEYINKEIRVADGRTSTVFVMAFSRGKDFKQIIKTLVREGDTIIATKFGPVDGMPWVSATDPQDIADVAKEFNCRVQVADSEHTAIEMAEATKLPIVVCGSLYLVGQLIGSELC